jgi:hypothetical protein
MASRNSSHDTYLCSSRHRGGPGCGMKRIWRELVDETVERLVTEQLCKAPVILAFAQAAVERQGQPPDRSQENTRQALEAKRKRIVEMRANDVISLEDCVQRVRAIDQELETLRSRVPAPPIADLGKLVSMFANAFAQFRFASFSRKRDLLQRAVREIGLSNSAIPFVTLKGGFLGDLAGVKLSPRSRWRCWRRC